MPSLAGQPHTDPTSSDQLAQEREVNPRLYQMLLGALRTLEANDAALVVPAGFTADGDVNTIELPGGKYAITRFVGKPWEVGAFWDRLFGEWLPQMFGTVGEISPEALAEVQRRLTPGAGTPCSR